MKFQECEHCGAALDFGEKCNCQEESELKRKQYESLFCIDADGQYKIGGIVSGQKDFSNSFFVYTGERERK
jgi:hypothetical protein